MRADTGAQFNAARRGAADSGPLGVAWIVGGGSARWGVNDGSLRELPVRSGDSLEMSRGHTEDHNCHWSCRKYELGK